MLKPQDYQVIINSLNFTLKNEPDALAASQIFVGVATRVIELQKSEAGTIEQTKSKAMQAKENSEQRPELAK